MPAGEGMSRKQGTLLFTLCIVILGLSTYGGIRSPDVEAVFRVGESLAAGRGLAVEPMPLYVGFGMAEGTDGRLYCIYPPFESFALVPFIKVIAWINQTHWYEHVTPPPSHFIDYGFMRFIANDPPKELAAHALRTSVGVFNVIMAALLVLLFWRMASRLVGPGPAPLAAALMLAFGTLVWTYSGTGFSEIPATLLILASLYGLMRCDRRLRGEPHRPGLWFLSGLALGLAIASHSTALLQLPFTGLYLLHLYGSRKKPRRLLHPLLVWGAGLALVLLLLGMYNFARFGSLLESGREISPFNKSIYHSPWTGIYWSNLYQLLLGPGKGLLPYCPILILAAFGWRAFLREHRALALIFAGAILARVFFVPAYHGWHGGFCLGPRYLVMIIPFALMPLVFLVRRGLAGSPVVRGGLIALLWAATAQQLYFALGEVFSYYHLVKMSFADRGLDVFKEYRIWTDLELTPLLHLHERFAGPILLQHRSVGILTVWVIGTLVLLLLAAWAILGYKGATSPRRRS